ncbi:Glu-tRNA(Gln) amidotransferase subunit GatE [Candidatus Woesearchaeota archaeon]|nr:Glu-tRNA(Gln) amidotransferase subunit GatE [Candidatus Woesearchaeota archaeon]
MAKKVNVTCGLEIHQQLDTNKLFCECPSQVREEAPDYTIKRKLRAVVGETGEVDIAAAQQSMKGKTYHYECYDKNTCLVDLDEEPPRNLRKEALEIAIKVGKLLDSQFVDEVQVMRKTVVDGSNTTGFQRTGLVAINGKLAGITIPTIIIEEDSARLIKDEQDKTTFRLDRIGIPLLEISTGPDIHDPEQAMEIAEKLGLILRSVNVKRGLGTIRQDVNVSIDGGTRVEIKGTQELKQLPTLVKLEAQRQERLLEIKEELKKRDVKDVNGHIIDATSLLSKSQSKIIQKALANGVVLGTKIRGFAGILGKELQPNKRLGTELSERAKTHAGVSGIFHSDELPNYGITQEETNQLKKHFDCATEDAFIIVAAGKEQAEKAIHAAIQRAKDALIGVPKEVRKANEDGTTTYLRAMPGAARMYPETDVLPVRLTKKLIDSVELPELIENKIKRYEKLGLGKDLAELCAKSDKTELFDGAVPNFKKLKPAYIAELLLTSDKTIKRQYNIDISPSDEDYALLLGALDAEQISKESVLEILKENKPVKEVLHKYRSLSDAELEREVKKIIEANKGKPFNALIGIVMSQLRGKASGQKIAEMLKRLTS